MDKEFLIQLTNKLYRLTLLFPKKEPLRYKIRDVADDILTNLIVYNSGNFEEEKEIIFNIKKDLEILSSYFEVSKWQNWVSYFDIIEIEEKYDKIEKELKDFSELVKKPEPELELEPELDPELEKEEKITPILLEPVEKLDP